MAGSYEVEAALEVGMCKTMALMINLCGYVTAAAICVCETLLLTSTCVLLF